MGFRSIEAWLFIILIVVIIFGAKRLRHIGRDLGEGVQEFRKGLRGNDQDKSS